MTAVWYLKSVLDLFCIMRKCYVVITSPCVWSDTNPILFYSNLFYSILFYSIPLYSIPFYSILFYSILFHSILFYSIPFYLDIGTVCLSSCATCDFVHFSTRHFTSILFSSVISFSSPLPLLLYVITRHTFFVHISHSPSLSSSLQLPYFSSFLPPSPFLYAVLLFAL